VAVRARAGLARRAVCAAAFVDRAARFARREFRERVVANSAGSAAAAAEAQVEERDLEPARLAFERALDTLTRDVRVRVGERI